MSVRSHTHSGGLARRDLAEQRRQRRVVPSHLALPLHSVGQLRELLFAADQVIDILVAVGYSDR